MTDENQSKTEALRISDPHNVQVAFVNQVVAAGHLNGVVNMTLGVALFSPTPNGVIDTDMIVASRLRMDMGAAMQMRDQLDRIIGQAEAQMKSAMATAVLSTATVGRSGKPS